MSASRKKTLAHNVICRGGSRLYGAPFYKTEWTNWSTCIIETKEASAKKRIIN